MITKNIAIVNGLAYKTRANIETVFLIINSHVYNIRLDTEKIVRDVSAKYFDYNLLSYKNHNIKILIFQVKPKVVTVSASLPSKCSHHCITNQQQKRFYGSTAVSYYFFFFYKNKSQTIRVWS